MRFWQVDAFTSQPFRGNPAAVVILERSLPDATLQDIAMEMNLSETAFILQRKGTPHLRWFTPRVEVDLCGHATLAAAHAYLALSGGNEVTFTTESVGSLPVRKSGQRYTLDFPARAGTKLEMAEIPDGVLKALSAARPREAFLARDLMLVYDDEAVVRKMAPDFTALRCFDRWIIVTCASREVDFVSRFFCAGDGIDEDPVTGSAHCTSTPYWARTLGKTRMRAYQASERGGDVEVELAGERVLISGAAVTVVEGRLLV